jgi:hypothetical protein
MNRCLNSIRYFSPLDDVNLENDNIEMSVGLEDGGKHALLVATPNNVFWCMENEGLDFFHSYPAPILVKLLNAENIERGIRAFCEEAHSAQFSAYAVRESSIVEPQACESPQA